MIMVILVVICSDGNSGDGESDDGDSDSCRSGDNKLWFLSTVAMVNCGDSQLW